MAKPKTERGGAALRLAFLRRCHAYVSLFVAPSLLFFALTGALQTFRIPDQTAAPVVIQKLARLHKDDVFAVKPARPKRPDPATGRGKPAEAKPGRSTEAMRYFAALVSVGIAFTTLFGLWMALAYGRRKIVLWALLLAGISVPVLILRL